MVIKVILKNKRVVSVANFRLADLINANEVLAFSRTGGWAIVGRDPIRSQRVEYHGPERRIYS